MTNITCLVRLPRINQGKALHATSYDFYGRFLSLCFSFSSHAVRLDWQMWFAALGNPQSNLWFLNLIRKLLDNCRPVQHLVGDPKLLSGRKLVKIRAMLYHYDFTRLETEWNQGIPGTKLLNTTDWTRDIFRRPQQYWQRQFSRMYLNEVTQGESVLEHLSRYGYSGFCDPHMQCQIFRNRWCHLAFLVRKHNFHLVPILLLCMSSYLSYRRTKRVVHCQTRTMPKEKIQ